MTEEEKKAIAYLRFYSNDDKDEYFDKTFKIDKFFCKKILNLIEKLQKENEDYEKDNNYLRKREEYLEKRREEICKIVSTQTTEFSVPKEKVREKIKVLEIQAEEFKNLFKSSYAMKDEYLNAKSKIQGYKEILEEE